MSSYSTILVGTDGSESSFRAVDKAAALAGDAGARLILACAYRPLSDREQRQAATEIGDLAYKVAGSHPADDVVADATARARNAGATDIDAVTVEGDPVDVLVSMAADRGVDLLVVGNRGLNSLAGRLLGSVPLNVAHRAPCDILIVHTTPRGR